ncbi:hypothetical protein D3C72_1013970 [compost metagenome]
MQRALEAGGIAQALVELELQDARQEVAGVRGVARHVVLGTRVEEFLATGAGRCHALVLGLQVPPGLVVVVRGDRTIEHAPAPAVDHQPERQERHARQRHAHLVVDDCLAALGRRVHQPDRTEVLRRHRQHDGVADRFMEAIVGTALEQRRQRVVGQVVIDVAQLVVDGGEVLFVGLDAHLGAHVAFHVHVPGAGVADHVAVIGLDELGLVPVRLRQRRHAQRHVEVLRTLGHLLGGAQFGLALRLVLRGHVRILAGLGQRRAQVGLVLLFQRRGDVQAAGARVRFQLVPQVGPVLLPHVAHQVRGDQAVAHLGLVLAIGLVQLAARIAVQLLVHRLDLFPQTIGFRADLLRRHVIATAPHLPGIGEAHALGTFVHQADELLVITAHALGGAVPALPGIELLVIVAAARQHLLQLTQLAA